MPTNVSVAVKKAMALPGAYVGSGVPTTRPVSVAEVEGAALMLPLGEAPKLSVALALRVGSDEGVVEAVEPADSVPVRDAVESAEKDAVAVAVVLAEEPRERLAVAVAVDKTGDTVSLGEGDGVALSEGEVAGLPLDDSVALAEGVG